jgi:hypothetical protein
MKTWLALFILTFSLQANAAGTCPNGANLVERFINGFNQANELTRSGAAFKLCTFILPVVPDCHAADYEGEIRKLGEAYKTNPEAAYAALDTCQSLWATRFLDPTKKVVIANEKEQIRVYQLMADQGLLAGGSQYLTERILLNGHTQPPTAQGYLKSPFEILSGMAASEEQLNLALTFEQERARAAMIGASVAGMGLVWTIADFVRGVSMTGARFVKQALVLAAAAWVIQAAEELRASNGDKTLGLLKLKRLLVDLNDPAATTPRPLILDQLYKSTNVLGYLYSRDVFTSESGENSVALPQWDCYEMMKGFLTAPRKNDAEQFAWLFKEGGTCQDAATLRLGAGFYLQRYFPNDAQAQALSVRFIDEAKRTFQLYEFSIQRQINLDRCEQMAWDLRLMEGSYSCDGATGKLSQST